MVGAGGMHAQGGYTERQMDGGAEGLLGGRALAWMDLWADGHTDSGWAEALCGYSFPLGIGRVGPEDL